MKISTILAALAVICVGLVGGGCRSESHYRSTRVISEQPVIGKPVGHPGAGKGAGWVE